MTARLTVRGLTVDFPGTRVIDGVDLDVAAGECVVVLGSSGSGKSTLLRALLGLVPAPGRVTADHMSVATADGPLALTDATGWARVRGREIGLVFQDPSLSLTPLRRVGSLVAEAAGGPARVATLLRDAGFADPDPVAAQRSYELSGGMAQRVGMALAVAGDPPVLLADEPTTALDGPARDELVGAVARARRDGHVDRARHARRHRCGGARRPGGRAAPGPGRRGRAAGRGPARSAAPGDDGAGPRRPVDAARPDPPGPAGARLRTRAAGARAGRPASRGLGTRAAERRSGRGGR